MRRRGDPAARGRRAPAAPVTAIVLLAALTVSCSAAVPASPAPSAPAPSAPAPSATPTPAFTVSGTYPVSPGGSQDTAAAVPGSSCDGLAFSADRALGAGLAHEFSSTGFPAAARLLAHFLQGTGTEVDYRAGSSIARQARASSAFTLLNKTVQAAIADQLRAGDTRIRLTAAQLAPPAFESQASDLYWAFRGTQGLAVTGHVRREGGRYAGTLTYVIRDSYGFPAGETLDGFGPRMRYLQTVCGAPQHAGGARWFPDSITVTVPFRRPV